MTEDEDKDKFHRWQICRPKLARAVSVLKENELSNYNHHEDSPAFQENFRRNADNVSKEIEQLENPFIVDDSKELIQLGT